MATNPIGGSPSPVITPNQFPPAAAALIAARLLNSHSAREIAEAVEVLVDLLDLLGGDPDLEDNGDDELTGDERDCAWLEWHGMRPNLRDGRNFTISQNEDDENDDPAEEGGDLPCCHFGIDQDRGPIGHELV